MFRPNLENPSHFSQLFLQISLLSRPNLENPAYFSKMSHFKLWTIWSLYVWTFGPAKDLLQLKAVIDSLQLKKIFSWAKGPDTYFTLLWWQLWSCEVWNHWVFSSSRAACLGPNTSRFLLSAQLMTCCACYRLCSSSDSTHSQWDSDLDCSQAIWEWESCVAEPPKYLGARILNQTNYMCFWTHEAFSCKRSLAGPKVQTYILRYFK